MKIIWNGHSCFTVETTDGTLVLDPYADGSVPGFGPLRLKADRVLCSHGPSDHGAVSCVTLSGRPCTIEVGEIHTWHDNVQGKKRGANTVYVMSAEGMKIAHLGDLGCALTEEQTALRSGLDALMIPVGGFYTIDAEQAMELLPCFLRHFDAVHGSLFEVGIRRFFGCFVHTNGDVARSSRFFHFRERCLEGGVCVGGLF